MPARTRVEVAVGQPGGALGDQVVIDHNDQQEIGDRVLRQAGAAAGRSTLPGAPASRGLLVSGTTTAVEIRLALNASPWTMRTGRRNPALDPTGSASDALQYEARAAEFRSGAPGGAKRKRDGKNVDPRGVSAAAGSAAVDDDDVPVAVQSQLLERGVLGRFVPVHQRREADGRRLRSVSFWWCIHLIPAGGSRCASPAGNGGPRRARDRIRRGR